MSTGPRIGEDRLRGRALKWATDWPGLIVAAALVAAYFRRASFASRNA